MSKRLPFAPLAAAIGLGFSLIAGSLVAPTVAHAEGEIRIAEQFGIVYLLLNVAVSYTHLTLPTIYSV